MRPQATVNYRWKLHEFEGDKVVKWNLQCLTDPDGTPADVMMVLYGAWAEKCAFVNPKDKIKVTGVSLEKKRGDFFVG